VKRPVLGWALSVALFAQPVSAQYSVGSGLDYMGYSFEEGLGADAAQLLMVPLAIRLPLFTGFSVDIFSAWAQGRVEQNNVQLKLSGPVDTNVKVSYRATPWALLSVGANIPTGNATHDTEEAVVASVLSADLYGFREATWGTGFALTSSVATAASAGGFGLGIAGAYAMRGEFEPASGDDLKYKPGSEARVRVGVDRNFGSSTLTVGTTFINYSADEAGANLFQAGNRFRFDASYAFRAGDGVWTIYAADVLRENGDVRVRDALGAVQGDSIFTTAKQNMMVGGLIGTVGLGGGFFFRPHLDFKYQLREEADGGDAGTGWVLAVGGDLPVRVMGGTEFFPKARVLFGSIRDPMGEAVSVLGMEFRGTLRLTF
jgi:hypothetical protein